MNTEDKELLNTVLSKLEFQFIKDILVKPLPEEYIEKEIEDYSRYKIIITDRYHGTILSLVAGTPVIILKTNDHKVTTGADWFKGVYDEHVFLANDLKNAYEFLGFGIQMSY